MAEGGCSAEAEAPAKVRVVRCPKCEKLLPELAGFSVYRCGGCSATLQALTAKQEGKGVASSEKHVGKVERSSSGVPVCVCVEEISLNGNGVAGCESNGNERVVREKLEVDGVIPPRVDAGDPREEGRGKNGGSRCHLRPPEAPASNGCSGVDEHDRSRGKKLQVEGGGAGMPQARQNGVFFKHRSTEEVLANQSTPRVSSQSAWLPPVPDEGSSYSVPRSVHSRDEGDRVPRGNSGIPTRVENLEQDRAELLRKLDELREQLSQSCKVVDNSNDSPPPGNAGQSLHSNGFHGHSGWSHGGVSSTFNRPSASHSAFMNGGDLNLQSYHPAFHPRSEMLGFAMPFGARMLPGTSYEPPHAFCPQSLSPNFGCGQFDQDPLMPYPHGGAYYHQPSCSCSHFCNQQWQLPSQARSSALVSRRVPNGHGFYPANGPSVLDPERLGHGVVGSSMLPGDPSTCQRLPFKNYNGRDCRPLAGGAPFVVCCNCSELLQVPQKHFLMGKGQCKLRCGACCQVILVELDKDGLVVSTAQPLVEATLQPNGVGGHRNRVLLDSCNGDYDGTSFNARFADERVVLPSYAPHAVALNEMIAKEAGMKLAEAENMEGMSSSSSASKGDRSPDNVVIHTDASNSRELQRPEAAGSHIPGLALREHFGYPPTAITANRTGAGNRSKRSDQEKVVCINGNFKQNSVKDVAVATELDLLVDEYPNPRLSEDSDEASKEDELPRMGKGGDSFFTGLIKKSFKHSENRKFRVSVNGHPLPDRVVKKAEKQAGPIQPGEYWYDFRAGFWGVMGQHCLGIIPPYIEEFNYPMPKNCSSGDTGVVVNGRELHQKDLELLAGRGLPTSRERSYIIDISGKVSDVISGEELDGLGKLAPTVEKMKHGFGMRVLKEMAD